MVDFKGIFFSDVKCHQNLLFFFMECGPVLAKKSLKIDFNNNAARHFASKKGFLRLNLLKCARNREFEKSSIIF